MKRILPARFLAVAGLPLLSSPILPPVAPAPAAGDAVMCLGSVATIVGSDGDDVLMGTAGNDVIAGLDGIDSIVGGAGDDVICGGNNPSTYDMDGIPVMEGLYGGPGSDILDAGPGPGWDQLVGQGGDDTLLGSGGRDWLLGGGGQDRLSGGSGDDMAEGEGGRDRVSGGPGRDYVYGGGDVDAVRGDAGQDRLAGGSADDRLLGGRGQDAVDYAKINEGTNCHSVTVNLYRHTGGGPGFGVDELRGIEDVWSGALDDVLIGDGRDNTFYTGIVACGRPTTTDRVRGGGGSDTLTFDSERIEGVSGGAAGVRIDLAEGSASWDSNGLNQYLFTSIENVIGSNEADIIMGNDDANRLSSGVGSVDYGDVIDGRGGDDLITGWLGDDELYGGDGDDELDGGAGENTIDGGNGTDSCSRPSAGAGAVRCEITP